MPQPKVSVIIPCYNHGHFLDDAIKSVEDNGAQQPYEVIIVNDGSTDPATITKLKELEGRGYRVIHQPNQGLGIARNNAIAVATGSYIVPLDADNKLNKGFLDKCAGTLDSNPDHDVVYTDCYYFGQKDDFLNRVGSFDILRLINMNYIDACSMYRKEAWTKAGGYDTKMPAMGHEDWDLWLNMAFGGSKFFYLPEPGYYYRVSPDSMNMTVTMPKGKENLSYLLEKYKDHIVKYYHPLYKKYSNYDWLFRVYLKKNKLKAVLKTVFNKWKA